MKRDFTDAQAEQIAATREIVKQIKAIPVWARTPTAYSHLCSVILAEIVKSGWGHTNDAEYVTQLLADSASSLEDMDRESCIGLDEDPVQVLRTMRETGAL